MGKGVLMERARRGGGRKSAASCVHVRRTVDADESGHGQACRGGRQRYGEGGATRPAERFHVRCGRVYAAVLKVQQQQQHFSAAANVLHPPIGRPHVPPGYSLGLSKNRQGCEMDR